MAKVTMPQLGESVAEGTIGRWLKQPGDTVAKYEPLVEVITDKVNAEVPSPFAGVLKEILAQEGDTVPNNAEIAVIETEDEALSGGTEAPAAPEPANGPAGSDERPVPRRRPPLAAPAAAPAPAPASPAPGPGHDRAPAGGAALQAAATAAPTLTADHDPNARMTPAVRRLLREHGLEPSQVNGTGGGGRITREDVIAVVEAQRTGTAVAAPSGLGPDRAGRAADRRAVRGDQRGHRVPRRRGRGPRPDDPDAQGHRRPDDPRADRAPRLRPDGGRRHPPRRPAREGQARVPGQGRPVAQLRPVRREGVGRGPQAQPDLQRPLDRRRACWPSAGSTSAWRWRSTTG